MRNKLYYIGGILLFCVAATFLVLSVTTPSKVLNSAKSAVSFVEETAKTTQINEIYDQNFIPSKITADRIASYVPQYEHKFLDDEAFYAKLFKMGEQYSDESDFHVYTSANPEQNKKLSIHKYMNYIHFESDAIDSLSDSDSNGAEKLSPLSAIDAAKAFLEEKALPIEYAEVRVSVENGGFSIIFLKKLDGLKNYAFPIVVKTDGAGNVIYMDYYNFKFDKLPASSVKSMKEAVLDLPIDFPEGTKIDLKSCELVYFYENSIVQPGYLFQGEVTQVGGFKCFVKASKFDS